MKILDLSAGGRNIWFTRQPADVVFVDIRIEVKPQIQADSSALPFADSAFDLVCFDPPHATFGPNGQMAVRYGSYKADEIRAIVRLSAAEAYRVSVPDALMAFKWSNHGQKLGKILTLMPQWEPLFGQIVAVRTKHASTTHWVMLRKIQNFKPLAWAGTEDRAE